MNIKDSVGIDISKSKLDVFIHLKKTHFIVENSKKGVKQLLKNVEQQCEGLDNLLFCFEHTGSYSVELSLQLAEKDLKFSQISGLTLKRSLGLVRGKNDKVDARRIADFAYCNQSKLEPSKLAPKKIMKLKSLLTSRDLLIKQRTSNRCSLKDLKSNPVLKSDKQILNVHTSLIKTLDQKIAAIEKAIKDLIEQDEELKNQHDLIRSIPGVGFVVAANMISTTQGFTCFKNARKYCCFAGLAPFTNESGSSIRGKTTVSHLANKKMKSLINMAALSAIRVNPELKLYFNRKMDQGKNKMSVINAVRNKLIHRVFAVINRQTPYVQTMSFAN